MTDFKIKNSYSSTSFRPGTLNARIFWVMVCVCALFIFLYAYSVYSSIDLSYRIEKELNLAKTESVLFQQAEERYINTLESLLDEGGEALGLATAKNQTFIERGSFVARAGL